MLRVENESVVVEQANIKRSFEIRIPKMQKEKRMLHIKVLKLQTSKQLGILRATSERFLKR
jgi:hypothetical protein